MCSGTSTVVTPHCSRLTIECLNTTREDTKEGMWIWPQENSAAVKQILSYRPCMTSSNLKVSTQMAMVCCLQHLLQKEGLLSGCFTVSYIGSNWIQFGVQFWVATTMFWDSDIKILSSLVYACRKEEFVDALPDRVDPSVNGGPVALPETAMAMQGRR